MHALVIASELTNASIYVIRFVFEGIDEVSLNWALDRAFLYFKESKFQTYTLCFYVWLVVDCYLLIFTLASLPQPLPRKEKTMKRILQKILKSLVLEGKDTLDKIA